MPTSFESLGSIPRAVFAVALLFVAAWGVGSLLIETTAFSKRRRWDNSLLRMAVGINLLGFAGIGLGWAGLLAGNRSIWLLVIAILPSFRPVLWHSQGGPLNILSRFRRLTFGKTTFGLLAFVTLGPALCYPTGWDEMVYHGVLPRRWMADGYPAIYLDLPYSGFPSFGEILFWLIAPVEALIGPRLLVWACWILGLLILTSLLRRFGAGRSSWLMTCCFAASPAVLMISANCYVESLMMMNVAAILLTAVRIRHGRQFAFGILAGGAAAIKLTGLVMLGLPCLWWLTMAFRSCRRRSNSLQATIIAITVSAPFYLRPWWATGNPCYPFLAEWFPSSPQALMTSQYHHTIGDLGFGMRSAESFFTAPFLLGLQNQLYDGGFGWQWLVSLGLAGLTLITSFRRHREKISLWPASFAAFLYVAWYFTSQQGRFAVPMVLAVTCIAPVALRRFTPPGRRLLMMGLGALTVICLPWQTASYYAASWETVAGRWTWEEGLNDATRGKYIPLLTAIEELTPSDSRVLLVYEHRLLYIPRTAQIGTPFFQEAWLMPPTEFASEVRLMRHLHDGGITHLVIAKSPIGPDWAPEFFERSQPIFRGIEAALQSRQLERIWESEEHLLIVVQPTSPRGN